MRRIRHDTAPEVTVQQVIISFDGINFPAAQDFGIAQGNVLEAIIGESSAGLSTEQGPATLLTRQLPGAEVVETFIELTTEQYVETATESAGSDWDNIAESEDAEDGTDATLTEGLVLVQGTLIGDFPDFVDKDALTITSVELHCYWGFANFLLPGTTIQIQHRDGALGLPVTLRTVAGNGLTLSGEDNTVTPEVFDITASGPDGLGAAWDWTALDDIQILYNATILVDAGLANIFVDTTKLVVEANLTETA